MADSKVEPPAEFRILRGATVGRHRLTKVFEGLDRVPAFSGYPGSNRSRSERLKSAWIHVVDEDTWMYVAPRVPPPFAKEVGWKPVLSRADCIVVGKKHLAMSRPLILYLDVLHEIYHLFQRRAGRNLWDLSRGYVGSPTELEAYKFSVREARRLGATDRFLRGYLRVEWVSRADHLRLLKSLGVANP